MMEFNFADVDRRMLSGGIELIFPQWKKGKERVCVFSPHDDDAIIGAGYAMLASLDYGAEVYMYIFCKGNAGYSNINQKDNIENIRTEETIRAYLKLGIKSENIIRFNYSDFSVVQNIGWMLNNNDEGSFKDVLTALRMHKITRLLVPNHYREHLDHTSVGNMGTFYSPQAGDPILVDWAEPNPIQSVLQYSVWADLPPEDSLINKRDPKIRANRIIIVPEAAEEIICDGIREYRSQGEIIRDLVKSRSERRMEDRKYIELYLAYDPRPKLEYGPYKELIKKIYRQNYEMGEKENV